MKRAMIAFTFIVITVFTMYISIYLSQQLALSPTYEGISRVMKQSTKEKTSGIKSITSIVLDFRGYDTLTEGFVLISALSTVSVILKKHKDIENSSQDEKIS